MHAQNAIVFAGDVSKMLWPKVKHKTRLARAEKRANRLRQLLNIQSDSLLQNLDIRNKMEHLDEYVDEWAAKDGPLICFNTWNMPPSEYVFYNLADSKFSMLGDEINLMDLSISVGKVQQAVKREIEPIKKRVWPFAPDSGA
jgi:hypothetical protein